MGDLLKGKNAVVTGSGRGLGRAYAMGLAAEGANVVINDIGVELDGSGGSKTPATEVVDEINSKSGGRAVANYDTVADYEAAGRIIKTCVDNFGSIDILVNNAGSGKSENFFETTPEGWDTTIKAHLYGTFNCSSHACKYMREKKWGRIISITSDGYRGSDGISSYAAAKGGIISLMKCMALDVVKYGITSNCIGPGAKTRLIEGGLVKFKELMEQGRVSEEFYNSLVNTPPPETVAPMVVYLASDYASGISGAVLGVTGGKICIHNVVESRAVYKDWREHGPWTLAELSRVIPRAIEPYLPPLKAVEPGE